MEKVSRKFILNVIRDCPVLDNHIKSKFKNKTQAKTDDLIAAMEEFVKEVDVKKIKTPMLISDVLSVIDDSEIVTNLSEDRISIDWAKPRIKRTLVNRGQEHKYDEFCKYIVELLTIPILRFMIENGYMDDYYKQYDYEMSQKMVQGIMDTLDELAE